MRPDVIAWFNAAHLHVLVWLVPPAGLLYMCDIFIFGFVFRRRVREAGLSTQHAFNLWILGAVSCVIGARLFYLVVNRGLVDLPARTWFNPAGTASWGIYVGLIVSWLSYCRFYRLPVATWFDVGPAIGPLCDAVGRIECWLAGDDFGRVSAVPWAIRFPAGSLPWQAHVASGRIAASAPTSLPVHPLQLYLAANGIALFFILALIWRRYRGRPGLTLGCYLLFYGVTRFLLEFLRDPAAGGAATGLSTSQWMCLAYTISGGALLLLRRGKAAASPV